MLMLHLNLSINLKHEKILNTVRRHSVLCCRLWIVDCVVVVDCDSERVANQNVALEIHL
jgi:hypothetical protein